VPAVFVPPRARERQLRESLQEALLQQDRQALRQLSDRLVHRHGPLQLQRWMQALASDQQQTLWREALAQQPLPVIEDSPKVEEPVAVEEPAAVQDVAVVEEVPQSAAPPIKTALQGWLPQWDGPQTDRLAS
jgi:hypothetical protein